MTKAFLIDTSRCTACRGCQIACKEWNELPANKTKQTGTHQNPPDLNPFNYKLVRFNEYLEEGTVRWYFFPDQCRHCIDPPCLHEAENYVEGAVIHDSATGAVVYTEKVRQIPEEGFQDMRDACPYDIPRRNPANGDIVKCDMCFSRITRGLQPMCVKTCPTGTMNFGDRAEMLALAEKRLAVVKKEHPKAVVVGDDFSNVIFLLLDDPEKFHSFAVAHVMPGLNRKDFLARMTAPLRRGLNAVTTF